MSDLTKEEKELLEWLRNYDQGRMSWSKFEAKALEIEGLSSDSDFSDSENIEFNLIGVTVTKDENEKGETVTMYPVRDLIDGIVRGYSTD